MDGVPYARAYRQRTDVAQCSSLFERYADEVVFADRDDFHGVRVFEVGSVRVGIGGEELLGGF